MLDIISSWVQSLPVNSACWLLVVLFVVLDFALGTIKSYLNKSLDSRIMREGIMHKIGFFGALILCNLIDIAQSVAAFDSILGFSVPVSIVCSAMIIICEIMSVYENIKAMNPDVKLDFLEKDE